MKKVVWPAALLPGRIQQIGKPARHHFDPNQTLRLVGLWDSRGCSRARNVPNIAEDAGGAWQEAAICCCRSLVQVLHFPRLSRKMLYGWWQDRDEGRWVGQSCQCNLTKTSSLPPAVLPRWNKPSGDEFLQPASRLPGCLNSISKAFFILTSKSSNKFR